MARTLMITGTAVVTAVLTSAFWIFAFNIGASPAPGGAADGTVTASGEADGMVAASGEADGMVAASGDRAVVDPRGAPPPVEVAEGLVVGPAGLAIPVAGVRASQLVDTFTQARASGARVHDAIDIMAPRGTPVVAAAPGRVEKLFFSKGGGGISAYVRSDDKRWIIYYAHLDSYAPGLAEGARVGRGSAIGRVGFTGNASPAGSHLHFAIHRMQPGERWHQGRPINPYPLLAGRGDGS